MPGCRLSQHQERLPLHWWQCYIAFPLYALSLPCSSILDIKALITGGWGHYEYPTPVDFPRPIELLGFVVGKLAFGLILWCPMFNPHLTAAWAFRQTVLMLVVGSFVTVLTFAVSHPIATRLRNWCRPQPWRPLESLAAALLAVLRSFDIISRGGFFAFGLFRHLVAALIPLLASFTT